MPIRIAQIEVEKAGPIIRFSLHPGSINLIYGHNEQGKTYLVEFLIRSLFRIDKKWVKRKEMGIGKVVVTGLEEKAVVFSPSSPRKFEDYWKRIEGLPPHFNRLLVVKGGEVALPLSEGDGVSTTTLRHFLSNQLLLDRIGRTISETIKKTEIHEGHFIGKQVGEIRTREERLRELQEIDRLFEALETVYVESEFKALQEQIKRLEEHRDRLERARRHRAYRLSVAIREKEDEIRQSDPEGLHDVREWLIQCQRLKEQIEGDRRGLAEAEVLEGDYTWLEQALEAYRHHEEHAKRASPLLWITPLLFLVGGLGSFLMDSKAGLSVFMALSALYSLLIVSQIPRFVQKSRHAEELRRIASAYETRFRAPLSSEADLTARLEHLKARWISPMRLREDIAKACSTYDEFSHRITGFFSKTMGSSPDPAIWQDLLERLEKRVRTLQHEVESLKGELQGLEVLPSEYEETDPGIFYSRKEEMEIAERITTVRQEITKREEALRNLKQQICSKTRDPFTVDWETLIAHLREKRQETAEAYRQITAEILGKMVVNQVLERLRKEEDRKIAEGLSSDTLIDPLYRLTGRYRHFKLDADGNLWVSDDLYEFPFVELSTGAQEQVLLALRMGFARRWLHRETEPLFLLFDDAFQHSDYQRRERLVDMVFDLATSGWQIFYFTMDDHLRGLFDQKGAHLQDSYVKRNLEEPA